MIGFRRLERLGRLGNQLWQIAATAGIAHSYGQPVAFPHWSYRPYFCIPEDYFTEHYEPWSRLPPPIEANETPLVSHIDPRAREYLQDYSLFKDIDSTIRQWFAPSTLAVEKMHENYPEFFEFEHPILSVHVRRGDNAKAPNNCHPLRPVFYYEEAIERLQGKFQTLAFFSDDAEWCRTNFGHYGVEHSTAFIVGHPRSKEHEQSYFREPVLDWFDLQLMRLCDLHVISNSTFGWWGAFLSHNPSPIYPTPWFGTELQYIDASLMFPEGWISIDHGQVYV